jgi:alpha-L-fucosidase
VSKGGNLLLNVGPDAKGLIPEDSEEILSEVGWWIDKNGESIYGCGKADLPKPEWGRYTQKGNKIYAHIYERGIGPLNIRGLAGKAVKARLLADNSEIKLHVPWNATEFADDIFIDLGKQQLPCEWDTVVEITLKD